MVNEFRAIKPKVSVIMITYGHEKYIKEAIEGVFLQKTDFLVELIIANDQSPDSSDEIIREVIKTCPSNISVKYILNENNLGVNANYLNAYENTEGKYIASCEGDDYWIDPLKLQKQVDFLENNEEYSITFHKIKEFTDRKEKFTYPNPDEEKTYTIQDLCKENFIITVSVVFRKNMETLPEWLPYSPIGDYPLHLLNASFGLIKYFPEEMAVYRVGSGMWSTQNTIDQIVNTMFCLKFLLTHFKNNQEVFTGLKIQYDNFQKALLKPYEEKKALELKIKDYNYLAQIISFNNLLKITKRKIINKLKK